MAGRTYITEELYASGELLYASGELKEKIDEALGPDHAQTVRTLELAVD